MIKIGLIGCGKVSRGHINAISEIQEAEIVAVCDISQENLEIAVKLTNAAAFNDYIKMIKEKQLDLVIINLPHALHNPCTCFCAEHKVNIFLEKPMGISEIDCKSMIDACELNNVMLWVGHLQRYQSENIMAKKLIDSGKYGKLIGIYETRNGLYFTNDRPLWFLDKEMAGGGIMMNLGAHTLDKIKYFTDSEIETAVGNINISNNQTVEDSVQAFIKTKNGIGATINLIGNNDVNIYETKLYLTNGEIQINLGNGINVCEKNGEFKHIDCVSPKATTLQMRDVVSALNNRREPKVNGSYGKDIIHAIEMIYNC